MDDNIFNNCSKLAIVYCERNSEADKYKYPSNTKRVYDSSTIGEDTSGVAEKGRCGNDAKYTLYNSGLLTISGSGDMTSYEFTNGFKYKIKDIAIEKGITSIGGSNFKNCGELESVTIPDSVTSIDSYAFQDCDKLVSVEIPNSVKSLGYCVFSGCTKLESVKLSNNLTDIYTGMFKNCTSLKNIEIPNRVREIRGYVFQNCTSLDNVRIPNSVDTIGERAFDNCSSLTSIEIPGSVTSIISGAFTNCNALKVYCKKGSVADKFDNNSYYPKGSKAVYGTMPTGQVTTETTTEATTYSPIPNNLNGWIYDNGLYTNKNSDVVAVYGSNDRVLYNHWRRQNRFLCV